MFYFCFRHILYDPSHYPFTRHVSNFIGNNMVRCVLNMFMVCVLNLRFVNLSTSLLYLTQFRDVG